MFLEMLLWPLFMSFKALNQYVDILFKNLRAYYSRQKNIFLVKMKLIKKRRSNFVLHSENTLREINLQKKILFYAVLISICNYLHCKCDKNDCNISKNKYEWFEKTWQKKNSKLVFYWTYHTPWNLAQNRFTTSTNKTSF